MEGKNIAIHKTVQTQTGLSQEKMQVSTITGRQHSAMLSAGIFEMRNFLSIRSLVNPKQNA